MSFKSEKCCSIFFVPTNCEPMNPAVRAAWTFSARSSMKRISPEGLRSA